MRAAPITARLSSHMTTMGARPAAHSRQGTATEAGVPPIFQNSRAGKKA